MISLEDRVREIAREEIRAAGIVQAADESVYRSVRDAALEEAACMIESERLGGGERFPNGGAAAQRIRSLKRQPAPQENYTIPGGFSVPESKSDGLFGLVQPPAPSPTGASSGDATKAALVGVEKPCEFGCAPGTHDYRLHYLTPYRGWPGLNLDKLCNTAREAELIEERDIALKERDEARAQSAEWQRLCDQAGDQRDVTFKMLEAKASKLAEADKALAEIAKRISVHLKRFEFDPKTNPTDKTYGTRRFFNANAHASGSRVGLTFVSYQGASYISKAEALEYLAWLDSGKVGSIYTMRNEAERMKHAR